MQPQPHRLLSLGVKNKDQVAHSTCGLQYLVIELSKLGQSFVSLDGLIICSSDTASGNRIGKLKKGRKCNRPKPLQIETNGEVVVPLGFEPKLTVSKTVDDSN